MIIETQRLSLIPLTERQLKLWIEDIPALEYELGCVYRAEPLTSIFLDIVKQQYEIVKKDNSNYLYYTFWFIILKTDKAVVGSADFKSIPNEKGEVEIGYGLGKKFEHNGYMTEVVKAMCEWALSQEEVSCVIAETERHNRASHHVLERCGFRLYKLKENLWWKL